MTIYTNPQATTEENLSLVLDVLCQMADRNICVFLPEKEEERIPSVSYTHLTLPTIYSV